MNRSFYAKGKRVRGYRIHVVRGSAYQPPSFLTPTMWAERPPLEKWQEVVADPTTQSAYIIQCGRKMQQFQFQRKREG